MGKRPKDVLDSKRIEPQDIADMNYSDFISLVYFELVKVKSYLQEIQEMYFSEKVDETFAETSDENVSNIQKEDDDGVNYYSSDVTQE